MNNSISTNYLSIDLKRAFYNENKDFTLMFWFNTNSLSGTKSILAQWNGSNTLNIGTEGNRISYYTRTTGDLFSKTILSTGRWYHVAVTYNATTKKSELYLDTVKEIEIPNFPVVDNVNATLFNYGNRYYYDGKLDEFRFYSRVLTEEEIKAKYNKVEHDFKDMNIYFTFDETVDGCMINRVNDEKYNITGTFEITKDTPFLYNKFLVKYNDKYYDLKNENYDKSTKMYLPIERNFENGFFDLKVLTNEVNIDGEIFKPYEKFKKFKLVSNDIFVSSINGFKTNSIIIVAKDDINLKIAEKIKYFKSKTTDNVKVIFSKDSGKTWLTCKDNNFSLIDVDLSSFDNKENIEKAKTIINSQGIKASELELIDFNLLKSDSVRFAYFIDTNAELDNLEWQFDAKGVMRQSNNVLIDVLSETIKITLKEESVLTKVNIIC